MSRSLLTSVHGSRPINLKLFPQPSTFFLMEKKISSLPRPKSLIPSLLHRIGDTAWALLWTQAR